MQTKWRDIVSLESEHLYSTDMALLSGGSVASFLTILFIKIIFQPRGEFLVGAAFFIVLLALPILSVGSLIFFFWRLKKYGIVISSIPLFVNCLTLLILLFAQPRIYLSDPDIIVYDRYYSTDGKYVYFAYTLNDGPLGTPIYDCVMAATDTAENLTNYQLTKELVPLGWNQDNSLNVRLFSGYQIEPNHYKPGETFVANGITIRVVEPISSVAPPNQRLKLTD
jgi:hypothetical protein